ncbi:MAG: hypothetical protein KGY70_16265 [Bacteroidales bacterium]|nr:hypothetical protein [Bacteroidales bacterium]
MQTLLKITTGIAIFLTIVGIVIIAEMTWIIPIMPSETIYYIILFLFNLAIGYVIALTTMLILDSIFKDII